METLYGVVKRDLPKCRYRHMAESPNSSPTTFCNGRYMVKGGSIPSSNLERCCFEWSNQNLFKDWKVIAVGTMLTAAETAITHLEYGEPYAVTSVRHVVRGKNCPVTGPMSLEIR